MEGKLIKQEKEYYALYTNKGIFISDVNGGSLANRLSLKNCEAIANGYDLDDLAFQSSMSDVKEHSDMYRYLAMRFFKEGFQKALELLGDNKELIIKLNDLLDGLNSFKYQVKASYLHLDCEEIIKSLQQTEWDVNVEMEPYHDGDFINDGKTHIIEAKLRPRLDVDGCLILKRK